MQFIDNYYDRKVFWVDYNESLNLLPDNDWVCFVIANKEPDIDCFDQFVRMAISKNVLEFKAHGRFGEKLHDLFDETIVVMEVMEGFSEIEVMTTWHNDETLADAFWQCFFATCLPDNADFNNIKIICTDLDGINRSEELASYIKKFELGWLPD
jgi:hypothetical protein